MTSEEEAAPEPEDDGSVCVDGYPEHEWEPGMIECRRCSADLSEWNEGTEE